MTKSLLAISVASLRQAPFFVLDGPDGRLACQWTAFEDGHAQSGEFEILCPQRPEAMGCLFGMFEDGEFRMRRAVRKTAIGYEHAADLDMDLDWRGDLNDVLDTGHDWDMVDGQLEICDPETEVA